MLLCLPCLLLGFSSVAFAAETVQLTYNVIVPQGYYFSFYPSSQNKPEFGSFWDSNLNYFANTNDSFSASAAITARVADEEDVWVIPYNAGYDYYLTMTCWSVCELENFTFWPTGLRYVYKNHDGTNTGVSLSDVKISHVDGVNTLGFNITGKFPDMVNGIKYLQALGSGTVGENLNVFFGVYIVPKSDDGTSADAAAVVSAIQDQTQALIDVPDDQQAAAEQYVDDKTAELQEVLTPLQAADRLSDSLLQTFQTTEKYNVHFPGLSGPFMPDGSVVTIIEEQDVDMSFMDRFSVITNAIGVVMLGLCGWKTLDFLYDKLMQILGKDGDSG